MIVIIPSDAGWIDAHVFVSFGRAPWFAMFDTVHKTLKFTLNKAAESQGGAGIKAAQAILDSGAEAVIAPRLGENAAEVLFAADIKVYEASDGSVEENIELFNAGKLKPLTNVQPGIHGPVIP